MKLPNSDDALVPTDQLSSIQIIVRGHKMSYSKRQRKSKDTLSSFSTRIKMCTIGQQFPAFLVQRLLFNIEEKKTTTGI